MSPEGSPDDASYAEAVDILGPILERMGFPEIAIEKYQGLVAGQGMTRENVSTFYRIARGQEATDRLEEARQTYSKILEVDLGFEDVQQRYRALKEGRPARDAASPSPPAMGARPPVPGGLVVLDEDTSLLESSVLFQNLSFDERRAFLALAERRPSRPADALLREGSPLPRARLPPPRLGRCGNEARGEEHQTAQVRPGRPLRGDDGLRCQGLEGDRSRGDGQGLWSCPVTGSVTSWTRTPGSPSRCSGT